MLSKYSCLLYSVAKNAMRMYVMCNRVRRDSHLGLEMAEKWVQNSRLGLEKMFENSRSRKIAFENSQSRVALGNPFFIILGLAIVP